MKEILTLFMLGGIIGGFLFLLSAVGVADSILDYSFWVFLVVIVFALLHRRKKAP
jgi:uncharacterized membrane protein YjfL (UPF0719 family)